MVNINLEVTSEKRIVQLNELKEFRRTLMKARESTKRRPRLDMINT